MEHALGLVRGRKSDLWLDQMDKKREMSAMYRGRIERLRLSEKGIEVLKSAENRFFLFV